MPATVTRYPRAITRFVDGSIQVHSPNGDFVCLDLHQQVGPLVCLRRLHPSVTQVWLTREQLQAVADVWATLCADVPDPLALGALVPDGWVADHVPGDEEPWEADRDEGTCKECGADLALGATLCLACTMHRAPEWEDDGLTDAF